MGKVIHIDSSVGGTGTGTGFLTIQANYTALTTAFPTAPTMSLAYVQNSQGTAWLPGNMGGSFYSKGTYLFDGASWVSSVDDIAKELQDILDTINTQNLESVLTEGNLTGANNIVVTDGRNIQSSTGDVIATWNGNSWILNAGSFATDTAVSNVTLSPLGASLALFKSTFTKIGFISIIENSTGNGTTGPLANYPVVAASQNTTINQNVINSSGNGGLNIIMKTDNTDYSNQNGYNTGLAGELIVDHTPSATDYTQTHQDDDGFIALTKNIPKAFFAVNLDSAESSISRVFAGGRTTFTVTHNLDTLDLKPEVFRLSDGRTMGWRIERTGVNTVQASRTGNVADGDFRILI